MFAVAGMLLATSCSKDELDTAQSGSEAQVTFSLGLEGGIGAKTRAISDGTSADKLVYAVFDGNGNRITTIGKEEKTGVSFPANVTLTLAKGQTYKVAFWAQDDDCAAYTLDDDMNVTVDYANATNNDETRDAFFKTVTFTVTGSTSVDVELKRPFAQINVGVTDKDWTAAVASGITIDQSSVTIKKAATSINLLTGQVSGSEDVTYSLANIPAEDLTADGDGDGVDETYKYLSMGYILVSDGSDDGTQKATLESLEFTFKPQSGNDIVLKEGLASVPVQRNYRTNILGQLLTGDIDFNISIAPIYDGDYAYPSGSAQELAMAAANGGTVTLQEDVELTKTLIVTEGKSLTVNLNGHDIRNTNKSETATTGVFVVRDGGKLTVTGNGTVDGGSGSANNLAVWAFPGSEVNISGGTYTVGKDKEGGGNSTIYTTGGVINISGGTFTTDCDSKNFILNVGQTQGAVGTINVTGGTFIGYDPATGDDALGGSYVAEGCLSLKISENPETWEVISGKVTDAKQDFSDLGKCIIVQTGGTIDGNGGTIVLENDNGGNDCVIYTTGGTIRNLTCGAPTNTIIVGDMTEDVIIDGCYLSASNMVVNVTGNGNGFKVRIMNSTVACGNWSGFWNGTLSIEGGTNMTGYDGGITIGGN